MKKPMFAFAAVVATCGVCAASASGRDAVSGGNPLGLSEDVVAFDERAEIAGVIIGSFILSCLLWWLFRLGRWVLRSLKPQKAEAAERRRSVEPWWLAFAVLAVNVARNAAVFGRVYSRDPGVVIFEAVLCAAVLYLFWRRQRKADREEAANAQTATASVGVETPKREIKFACLHCGQHLCVEADCAGMEVECPTCGTAQSVPIPEPTAIGAASENGLADSRGGASRQSERSGEAQSAKAFSIPKLTDAAVRIAKASATVAKSFATYAAKAGCAAKLTASSLSASAKAAAPFAKRALERVKPGGKATCRRAAVAAAVGVAVVLAVCLIFSVSLSSGDSPSHSTSGLGELWFGNRNYDLKVYASVRDLYFDLENNYNKYREMRKEVYELDHTRLSRDMREFVARFVELLDRIGELERRIEDCRRDCARERDNASLPSAWDGGEQAGRIVSMFDDGDTNPFVYFLAGVIGGAMNMEETDSRIVEKYDRIVRELRERERGLYLQFRQEVNKAKRHVLQ